MLRYLFFVSGLFAFCAMRLCAQPVSITGHTSFHQSVVGNEFGALESTNIPDQGGFVTYFIQNQQSQPDTITQVKFSAGGNFYQPHYYFYPVTLQPNSYTALLAKMISYPFREGDTLTVELTTAKGYTATQTHILRTPALRLANIIPSQDRKTLYVYLRNDGATVVSLLEIFLNGNNYAIPSPAVNILGGNSQINAGSVAIVKIALNSPMRDLENIFLAVRYSAGNTLRWVSTFQRLVEPRFVLGTWHTSLFNHDKEYGRKRIRQYAITSVFGPYDFNLMQNAYDEYHLECVHEPNFDSAGTFGVSIGSNYVKQYEGAPCMHMWLVEDEPDLSNKPINQEMAKSMAYWLNDSNTASYINLASQKKYQRYAFFTDIVSMDHYTDDGAPNVIPLSWYTREGSVREAIEYTDVLKWNSEPKRMFSWCQLAAGSWGNLQAEDFIINFQFWSHVSSGAKGIHFFVATPDTKTSYPSQWEEGLRLTRQLNTVKNLFLYGESWKGVQVKSGQVVTRATVGEDAMLITVMNNTIDYTPVNIILHDWSPSIAPAAFEVEFTVPDWIPIEQFYEATEEGKKPLTGITHVSGRTYRINASLFTKSRVYVIGKNDTTAPGAITGLVVPDKTSPNSFTLSWREPYDNVGIRGYYIYADNQLVDSVPYPIWDATEAPDACEVNEWQVRAYDDAGNLGQGASVSINWAGIGSGTPVIYQHPQPLTVQAGSPAVFEVRDSSAAGVAYRWQADTGNGVWFNLINDQTYSGVHSPKLTVQATQHQNGHRYRCRLKVGCDTTTVLYSESALLEVTGTLQTYNELNEYDIRVFPNPARDYIYIQLPAYRHATQALLFDLHQRMIAQTNFSPDGNAVLSLHGIPSGMYMLFTELDCRYIGRHKIVINK
ncbi:MAG: T9SS type A sorting domain-containing protein [Chitinophagales bacterium]|nr:T9SS type A sorting domain-containing protein [Chitinophagales bacterium]MDW8417946.1 hypothetical protein [Chitinophagales bacterium]